MADPTPTPPPAKLRQPKAKTTRLPLIAPLAALLLLGGVAYQRTGYEGPAHFEPFHAAVAEHAPAMVKRNVGVWSGTVKPEDEQTRAAIELLRPNVLMDVRYRNMRTRHFFDGSGEGPSVSLLLVQCKSSRDMLGHYPPNCYPNVQGWTLVSSEPRNWDVGGRTVPGMGYEFRMTKDGRTRHLRVYNFMIVPGATGAIVRDMDGVNDAAEDYRRRYYGAAQVQMVFDGRLSRAPAGESDAIFAELLEPMLPLVDLLREGLGHELVAAPVTPTLPVTADVGAGTDPDLGGVR